MKFGCNIHGPKSYLNVLFTLNDFDQRLKSLSIS